MYQLKSRLIEIVIVQVIVIVIVIVSTSNSYSSSNRAAVAVVIAVVVALVPTLRIYVYSTHTACMLGNTRRFHAKDFKKPWQRLYIMSIHVIVIVIIAIIDLASIGKHVPAAVGAGGIVFATRSCFQSS